MLAAVRSRVADQGATVLSASVRRDDPAATALAAGTRVLGELLRHDLPPTLPEMYLSYGYVLVSTTHDLLSRTGA